MSRKLVAYFSASGVTAKVAETLAEAIGADIYEIEPAVPYSKADLDWTNQKSRSSVEMSDPTSRPAIAGKRDNMDDYDTIFIGFPIWRFGCGSCAGGSETAAWTFPPTPPPPPGPRRWPCAANR